jgi:hypothetical protein
MRLRVLAAVAVVVCLAAPVVHGQQQFQVYAHIANDAGAPLDTVQPDDIRVVENGVEAKILKIEPVSIPVKLQLLLDNGLGIGGENMPQLKNGVQALIDALPPGVEVTVVSTAPQPRVLVKSTSDRAAIAKGLALLAADNGAGHFVDSLNEAAARFEKDKGEYAPVIVAFATTAGDRNVRDTDLQQLFKHLQARPPTVHVVLLTLASGRSAGGGDQVDVGIQVTKMTGGRFENIAASSRLVTLLPEIGAQVAKAHESQIHQFKITAERPAGASGPLKSVSMGARAGLAVTGVSFDGRVRN